jgi:hypothetical protein
MDRQNAPSNEDVDDGPVVLDELIIDFPDPVGRRPRE